MNANMVEINYELDRRQKVILDLQAKLAESRAREQAARLEEAEWWEHLVPSDHDEAGKSECLYCQRLAMLRAGGRTESDTLTAARLKEALWWRKHANGLGRAHRKDCICIYCDRLAALRAGEPKGEPQA